VGLWHEHIAGIRSATACSVKHRPVVIARSGKLRVGDGGVGVTVKQDCRTISVKVGSVGEAVDTGASFHRRDV